MISAVRLLAPAVLAASLCAAAPALGETLQTGPQLVQVRTADELPVDLETRSSSSGLDNLDKRAVAVHGYPDSTSCTGDYYIWTSGAGCYTYVENGATQKMYSLYLEGGCYVQFFSNTGCSGSNWVDNIDWDKGGCRGVSSGFWSFRKFC